MVKLNDACGEKADAILQAEQDLNRAFDTGRAAEGVAYSLKALGYIRVEDFKIVGQNASPVA